MAALATTHPTLLDLARVMDPEGRVVSVVEILNETNEILEDMVWQEGNLLTGHRTTVRTGLPDVTWRKLYGGVQPSKSTHATVTDSCGMLEAYAEVDKALADLNGNTGAFRTNEDRAFLESMNQELADTLFYGNEGSEPEAFTGLSPRYNNRSTATNKENIIHGGGSDTDNQSIWLVVWGPNTVHGIIPKGSRAGFQITDKGQVTIENVDGAGGRMEAYRTHYRWDAGITVRDWRYVVRIANIDKSLLIKDYSTGADLHDLMMQAIELIPNLNAGRPVFYVSRAIRSMLSRQAITKVNAATLTMEQAQGSMNYRRYPAFQGIPIRRVDAIAADEALVS